MSVYTIKTMRPAPTETPAPPQPQGCTNLKLRMLGRRVAAVYDAEVGQTGLKGTQYSLLSHVVRLGPVPGGELARLMSLSPSSLSRSLRPLIEAGWVRLGTGADERTRPVEATEAGRAKRAEAQRRWRVAQEAINRRLGPERVIALHALLDEAMTCLDDTPG